MGAGDQNNGNVFTADDFGFGDDDGNVKNPDCPSEAADNSEEPDTLQNLRRNVLTPPPGVARPGLFGGSPSNNDMESDDWNLNYEDSPFQGRTARDDEDGDNDRPRTRSFSKRKQSFIN